MSNQIHFPAWIPVIHPMSGRRISLLVNYIDDLITPEHATELEEQYALPDAPGYVKLAP